jgi:hypothetical protein
VSVIKLTRQAPVPVHFSGGIARQGPLTLGQLNILEWMTRPAELLYQAISCGIGLPEAAHVEDLTDSLSILIARHEALRTAFVVGPRPCQRVASGGTLMVDVYSVEDDRASRVDLEAELVRRLHASAGGQPAEQRLAGLPLRVAMVTKAEVVCAGVVEFSHLAVDGAATTILADELAALIRDPAARAMGPSRHQPLDQAELERSELTGRRIRRALEYWSSRLAVMPSPLYLTPRVAPGSADAGTGDPVSVEMSSAATALAVECVRARTRTSRASCVLAALCAVLSARTGYRELVFPVMSSNRFERHLSDYVGTLAQTAIVSVDVGSASFDELVRRASSGMLKGCDHGTYDIYQRLEIANSIARDRGIYFCYEPIYNCNVIESGVSARDQVPAPECVTAALGRARLHRESTPPRLATPVRFDVLRLEDEVVLRGWSSDVGRVPAEHVESLLLAVERLLVAAAHGNLDHERIRDAVQLEPVHRDQDWVLNDCQWVELTEIQRLLDEALAPASARIFAEAGGEPLVAYVAARGSLRTPEQAHARCMAMLPAHPAATTPRRYVICDTVPADPRDLAGWRGVVSAGTGRTSTP